MAKILSKFHAIQDKTLTGHCVACIKKKLGRTCDILIRKKHYHAAYQTLEDELKAFADDDIPLPLGVNLQCLDDGTGIASTMLKNEAKYHNGCRGHFRSHNLQRVLKKRARKNSDGEDFSPKKTRSSFSASLDRKNIQCVYCEMF